MNLLKTLYFLLLLPFFAFTAENRPDPETSLKRLMEGNQRYMHSESLKSGNLKTRRKELFSSQAPFATIVGCSDSRVPPEIIFDQSLGDIFVIRVAGNVIGSIESDSIQFSADTLRSSLILILGHQGCSAVNAVLQDQAKEYDLEHIAPFIQQAVDETRDLPGDPLTNAIKANVQLSVQKLHENPVLESLVQNKKLKIIGGYYELKSGKVELLTNN